MMRMDKKYDSSKRRSFLAYCKKKLVEKGLRERDFTSEPDTDSAFYHYYVPYGSHAHFIIQIDIADFMYKDKLFALGFQYQNESCKLNCLRPGLFYNTSVPDEIDDLIPIFKKDKYIYSRINGPRARAYISMSKKVYSIGGLSDEEFSKKLFDEFKKAIEITEVIKIEFEKIGCQFI